MALENVIKNRIFYKTNCYFSLKNTMNLYHKNLKVVIIVLKTLPIEYQPDRKQIEWNYREEGGGISLFLRERHPIPVKEGTERQKLEKIY